MMQHQLFAKESKYFFGVLRIEHLGHFIIEHGVSTDPRMLCKIGLFLLLLSSKDDFRD